MPLFKFPLVRQVDSNDCAFACIRMLCKYYRNPLPDDFEKVSRRAAPIGISVKQIEELLGGANFKASSELVSWEELRRSQAPLIVLLTGGHFAVVVRVSSSRVQLADPAYGMVSLSIRDFIWRWQQKAEGDDTVRGWIILATPEQSERSDNDYSSGREVGSLFRFLAPTVRPYISDYSKLAFCIGIGALLAVAVPILTQIIVDAAMPAGNLTLLFALLLGQLVVTLGRIISGAVRAWFTVLIGMLAGLGLREGFISKLMKLPMEYYENRAPGNALERFRDYSELEIFLSREFTSALVAVAMLCAYGVVIFVYSPAAFAVLLVGAIIAALWSAAFLNRLRDVSYKLFLMTSQSNNVLLQILSGMLDIKLANKEDSHKEKWKAVHSNIVAQNFRRVAHQQAQSIGVLSISELRNVSIVAILAVGVTEGNLTLGMMLAVLFIVGQINDPLSDLIQFITTKRHAHWAAERAEYVLSYPDEDSGGKAVMDSRTLAGTDLILENVSYCYPGDRRGAIQSVSAKINSGQITALIGESGSGKTTMLKLLAGLHPPSSGRIMIGSTPISEYNKKSYRKYCSGVFGDSFLFSDSLLANVTLWEDNPCREALVAALNGAGCGGFVKALPMGVRTRIGSGGVGLSTGQKQRILLARALYQNPALLLLDEPTSSLDSKNEEAFLETLRSIRENRTIVMAAHRLSTIQMADSVIVMRAGRLIFKGGASEAIAIVQSDDGEGKAFYDLEC